MIKPARNTEPAQIKPVKKAISQASKEIKANKKVVKTTIATVAKKDRTQRKLDSVGLREKMQELCRKTLS